MRIRKHTKLSGGGRGSVLFGLDDNFQTHVCQLNQSPWDVIPFGSDSSLQFDGDEDSFTGNGSRGDSVGAVDSVASMMDAENQTKPFPKVEDMVVVVHDNEAKVLEDIDEGRVVDETIPFCQKTDGKNWHCKNEAKPGQSFCDHHLPLLRSYNNNNSVSYNSNNTSSSKKAAAAASSSAAGVRRGKARAAKRASSSSSLATSNLYEFYYYSGFGPSWGKRRGDRHGEGSNNNHRSKNEQQMKGVENSSITEAEEANEEATQNNTLSPSSSSSSSQMMDNEQFDYGVDDDDEEEEANGDGGKKRMRKPVKARSLKSLM